jgi:hypothetical protein
MKAKDISKISSDLFEFFIVKSNFIHFFELILLEIVINALN